MPIIIIIEHGWWCLSGFLFDLISSTQIWFWFCLVCDFLWLGTIKPFSVIFASIPNFFFFFFFLLPVSDFVALVTEGWGRSRFEYVSGHIITVQLLRQRWTPGRSEGLADTVRRNNLTCGNDQSQLSVEKGYKKGKEIDVIKKYICRQNFNADY